MCKATPFSWLFPLFLLSIGCQPKPTTLFESLPSSKTGIDFVNQLDYSKDFNIYTYRNFYNGGGVGLGDFNNDGLLDIYFIANMGSNQLFLNLGDWKFENITEAAGVPGQRGWSTGVSIVDINGDGWQDIYVCNSGDVEGDNKQNELFINNGDLTFTQAAEAFGIADQGYSTHAAFFDYDRDGDLDMYLLNNSYQAIGSFNLMQNERSNRDEKGGDKLFKNDGNRFADVSEEAGIYGSVIGFGLGVSIGDLDKDGWLDIYVANDFFERDYIYMNNGDGTFREELTQQMRSISAASMAADMADINNDLFPDIFVTEMLPEDNARQKSVTTFEDWAQYQYGVKNGYYHQFTRNMLHLNNGDNTFSEIGRLSKVHATDWSWGALIADLNNDGYKDIFVANGIFQDLTDQDYLQYISNREVQRSIISEEGVDFQALVDAIPSNKVSNYAFANDGANDYSFTNRAEDWGLSEPSHSNGAAYGDFDNDGDLDLVVNNVNMQAFVYRNHSRELNPSTHFLTIAFDGKKPNNAAIGTKVTVITGTNRQYSEQMPTRGFQSTVDDRLLFGLGAYDIVDTLIVEWPDGWRQVLTNINADTVLTLSQPSGTVSRGAQAHEKARPLFESGKISLPFKHKENPFVDFDRDRLTFHMLSNEGPRICSADFNSDGLEDVFIGGAKGQPGKILIQKLDGSFVSSSDEELNEQAVSEDIGCACFDADGDGDIDLYVASGGNEFAANAGALRDRLYFNNGEGQFTFNIDALPRSWFESSSVVAPADFDGDGDFDLFVGTRLKPFLYGLPVSSYLLQNDGNGMYTDITDSLGADLKDIGLVTDAAWQDIEGDGDLDLMVVGEWMPITVIENTDQGFRKSQNNGLDRTHGWWNTLYPADIDGDGDVDFVAGNHGLNSQFRASLTEPVRMYINDFDKNGTVEHIITLYNGGLEYPLTLKHDIEMQIPGLKKKYLNYAAFKDQQITDIFSEDLLNYATILTAYRLETSIVRNLGDGNFSIEPLPVEAQFSPVYAIMGGDYNMDGAQDLLIGGNQYKVKPQVGRYDASYGLFLRGDSKGNFVSIPGRDSGFRLDGEIRDLEMVQIQGQPTILAARTDDTVQSLKWIIYGKIALK